MPMSQNAERRSTRSTSRARHATRDLVHWHWTVAGPAFPPGVKFARERERALEEYPALRGPVGENTRGQNDARERSLHTQRARRAPIPEVRKSPPDSPLVLSCRRYPPKQISNGHSHRPAGA